MESKEPVKNKKITGSVIYVKKGPTTTVTLQIHREFKDEEFSGRYLLTKIKD